MIPAGNTLPEAKRIAQAYSKEHPESYVTLFACFGLYLSATKRLHVNAPADSIGDCYWKAGIEKPFTESQRIQDQLHTPTTE